MSDQVKLWGYWISRHTGMKWEVIHQATGFRSEQEAKEVAIVHMNGLGSSERHRCWVHSYFEDAESAKAS